MLPYLQRPRSCRTAGVESEGERGRAGPFPPPTEREESESKTVTGETRLNHLIRPKISVTSCSPEHRGQDMAAG